MTVGGKTYEVEVEVLEEKEGPQQPQHGSFQQAPAAFEPPRLRGADSASRESGGTEGAAKYCLSPVMGLVIKIHVRAGQAVGSNDPIMVLEAMKMETNITAPHAGVVRSVHVAEGDSVKVNQVLVEFE